MSYVLYNFFIALIILFCSIYSGLFIYLFSVYVYILHHVYIYLYTS